MTLPPAASFRSTGSRIALALALSLLAHMALLLGPLIDLPQAESTLPPLMAKLEPLPALASIPKAPHKKPPRATAETPAVATTEAAPASERMPAEGAPSTDGQAPATDARPAETPTPDSVAPPKLPRHALLVYSVYLGTSLKVGEMRHRFDVDGQNRYTLDISAKTTGFASMFKSLDAGQHSEGLLTDTGLRPEAYRERKNVSGSRQEIEVRFQWDEHALILSDGNRTSLHEGAQDMASFLYQLSQLPLKGTAVPIYISNGRKLERYELEVGAEEMVQTNIGRLRALPLRKVHGPGEEGLDIWLALEYRLLPVKIRQIERDGHQAGEMLISEIRVGD